MVSAAQAARFARGIFIRCFNNLVKDRLALREVEGVGWAQLCVLGGTGFSVVFSSGGRRLPEAVLYGGFLCLLAAGGLRESSTRGFRACLTGIVVFGSMMARTVFRSELRVLVAIPRQKHHNWVR